MSADGALITAIDVGTTKVCTIVGRRLGATGVQVLAHSTVPCDGLRKGNVYDVTITAAAVRDSIEKVELATGLSIKSASVGITGSHVCFENRRDKLEAAGATGVITADDMNRTPKPIASARAEPGRKILHTIRRSYALDGETGIRNPLGMHSRDIEVETHVVTAGSPYVNKLVKAVEDAGVRVEYLVLEPLASGMAVLKPDEQQRGAIVVDIGGGTTDVVGVQKGRICYTGVIPVGGYQFTNDIAATFNTPYPAAEATKLRYGNTEIPINGAHDEISLPAADKDIDVKVRRIDICRLTRERAQELIQLVGIKLEEADMEDPSGVQVVLTGGASNLPGLPELMQRRLDTQVRQGVPDGQWPIPEDLRNPSYATSVGILLWAATEAQAAAKSSRSTNNNGTNATHKGGFLSVLFRRITRRGPLAVFIGKRGRS